MSSDDGGDTVSAPCAPGGKATCLYQGPASKLYFVHMCSKLSITVFDEIRSALFVYIMCFVLTMCMYRFSIRYVYAVLVID
jgi:hypothetical protein